MKTLRGFNSHSHARTWRLRILKLAKIFLLSICRKHRQLQKEGKKCTFTFNLSSTHCPSKHGSESMKIKATLICLFCIGEPAKTSSWSSLGMCSKKYLICCLLLSVPDLAVISTISFPVSKIKAFFPIWTANHQDLSSICNVLYVPGSSVAAGFFCALFLDLLLDF